MEAVVGWQLDYVLLNSSGAFFAKMMLFTNRALMLWTNYLEDFFFPYQLSNQVFLPLQKGTK